MRLLRLLCFLAVLPALTAGGCGGGGNGDSSGPGSPSNPQPNTITTYRDTTLPGRLLVNSPSGKATVYDLQTGVGSELPFGSTEDYWVAGASGNKAIRARVNVPGSGVIPISIYDTKGWSLQGNTSLSSTFSAPKLSADGQYLLTFWSDESAGEGVGDAKLTIVSAATGKVVKRGSQLDGETGVLSPFAWLPDGTYVYLAGNKLYRSSPDSSSSQLVATLDLPDNSTFQNGNYLPGYSYLVASPDGTKLAFTWTERPNGDNRQDTNLWVVNVDGSGLHRVTVAPDLQTALDFSYSSPTWSPDGKWIAGVLYMDATSITPVYPPDDTVAPAWQVSGTTGCATNPVFVVPADARNTAISWPTFDKRYGVKVVAPSGGSGLWMTTCSTIAWLP